MYAVGGVRTPGTVAHRAQRLGEDQVEEIIGVIGTGFAALVVVGNAPHGGRHGPGGSAVPDDDAEGTDAVVVTFVLVGLRVSGIVEPVDAVALGGGVGVGGRRDHVVRRFRGAVGEVAVLRLRVAHHDPALAVGTDRHRALVQSDTDGGVVTAVAEDAHPGDANSGPVGGERPVAGGVPPRIAASGLIRRAVAILLSVVAALDPYGELARDATGQVQAHPVVGFVEVEVDGVDAAVAVEITVVVAVVGDVAVDAGAVAIADHLDSAVGAEALVGEVDGGHTVGVTGVVGRRNPDCAGGFGRPRQFVGKVGHVDGGGRDGIAAQIEDSAGGNAQCEVAVRWCGGEILGAEIQRADARPQALGDTGKRDGAAPTAGHGEVAGSQVTGALTDIRRIVVADAAGIGVDAFAEDDAGRVTIVVKDDADDARDTLVIEDHGAGGGLRVGRIAERIEDTVRNGHDLDGLNAARNTVVVEEGGCGTAEVEGGRVEQVAARRDSALGEW